MGRIHKADKHTRAEHIETLRKNLNPGSIVYASVAHVSRSGMSRLIRIYFVQPGGTLWDITGLAGQAIGWGHDRDRWGIPVSGCGMDMCFHTVYTLSRVLFPEGFGVEMHKGTRGEPGHKVRRPKTRKSAAAMLRAGWKSWGRNGDASGWDNDGGYALIYRSL